MVTNFFLLSTSAFITITAIGLYCGLFSGAYNSTVNALRQKGILVVLGFSLGGHLLISILMPMLIQLVLTNGGAGFVFVRPIAVTVALTGCIIMLISAFSLSIHLIAVCRRIIPWPKY